MAFGKPIKIYRASIVVITILAFFIGITAESWHNHEHSHNEQAPHTTTSHNGDDKNPTNPDRDDCPLCNVHITKDITLTDIHIVQADICIKEHKTFFIHTPYTQPLFHYSARGPPLL